MNRSDPNPALAKQILWGLLASGVRDFCVCPGARNAPLIGVLTANPELFHVFYFFEERCAAFFALGRMKETDRPVAVVTTSGTAVGELMPATMEAYYAGLPLVLLTADRPKKYRGTGAPQTAEQVGLFGVYVQKIWDLDDTTPGVEFSFANAPIHINACFDEPLLQSSFPDLYKIQPDGLPGLELTKARNPSLELARAQNPSKWEKLRHQVESFFKRVKNPAVIVGMLPEKAVPAVAELLVHWQIPVVCEGLSSLRENPRLSSLRVFGHDQVMTRARRADYPIDGLIRIGGVPTLRLWRDLDLRYSNLPVLSLSSLPFSGLGRESQLIHGPLEEICLELQTSGPGFTSGDWRAFVELDQQWKLRLESLLQSEPTSEPGMLAALSRLIPRSSRIYLGNSLPLREWDLAATSEDKQFQIWASRGLNGIDGQVSTFLGYSAKGRENWGILGDLTALYDLPGPWILPQLEQDPIRIAIINNGGGKIFSRIFPLQEFQNQHELRFQAWAQLWNMDYECWSQIPEPGTHSQKMVQSQKSSRRQIIEILPNEEATQRFWKKYSELETTSLR